MSPRQTTSPRLLLTAWLLLNPLSACAPEDILLVEDARRGQGGTAGAGGAPASGGTPSEISCTGPEGCTPLEFCERTQCGAAPGVCRARPALCDGRIAPVCGCDGITYLNECLRRAAGVSQLEAAECGRDAQVCDLPGSCPGEAFCARIAINACGPGPGKCWVVPASCAPEDPNRFAPCGPPSGASCVDSCTAIRSEQPYIAKSRCP